MEHARACDRCPTRAKLSMPKLLSIESPHIVDLRPNSPSLCGESAATVMV